MRLNSIRILSGFLLALGVTLSAAEAANVVVPPCSAETLTKTLAQKIGEDDAKNLSTRLWWTRCPIDIRKTVWQSFLLKPADDGSAAWQTGTSSPLPILRNAPGLSDTGQWFNSSPLSMSKLRGKVVLIDFWTLGCINCIRTLPKIEGYYKKYGSEPFVVIGVHSPEFSYEKSIQNLQTSIAKNRLTYPIVTDNDFTIWNAYGNQYWPAVYLVDRQGRIRYTHFGEGGYDETDRAIAELLAEAR